MEQELLTALTEFIDELKRKEAATVYTVPGEIMAAVKKAKNLEKLLHDILTSVSGSGGLQIIGPIRREFGMSMALADRIGQWAPYSREQFEDALHDAIDRTELRPGKLSLFFKEGPSDRKTKTAAVELLKGVAHAAIKCQFQPKPARPDAYVELVESLLRYYTVPLTIQAGQPGIYRTLMSEERLKALSGNDASVTDALKEFVKAWYRHSSFTFLENREWYPVYTEVPFYLYALTEEQLERLRQQFIRYVADEFKQVQDKGDLHQAEYLRDMLEAVLGWKV